nr:lipopolysaccharide biosynthesis protein [Rhodoblastus sphagnicola]
MGLVQSQDSRQGSGARLLWRLEGKQGVGVTPARAPSSLAAPEEKRGRRAVTSSVVGVGQRLLQIASVLFIMPLVLHMLGRDGFGVWSAAVSLSWMAVTVDFGVGQALLTSVARNRARGDLAEIRREIGAAVALACALCAIGVVLALTIIPAVAARETADAYLISALCLAANIPFSLSGNIWTGLQRFNMALIWEAFQTIITVCGLFALTRESADVRWYVAITAGGLLVANACSTVHLFVRHPELLPNWGAGAAACFVRLLRSGAPFFLLGLAAMLSINLDSVITLSALGSDAASRMAVAQRACLTAYGLLWVVTQPLWPAFTDATTRGDHSWVRRHIFTALGIVGLCAISGCAVLVLFGQRLVAIWMNGELEIDRAILLAASAWIIALSMGRVVDVLLNGVGAVWFQARMALALGVVAFALKFALAPVLGVAGIVGATPLAYALIVAPAYVVWLRRWLRQGVSTAAAARDEALDTA